MGPVLMYADDDRGAADRGRGRPSVEPGNFPDDFSGTPDEETRVVTEAYDGEAALAEALRVKRQQEQEQEAQHEREHAAAARQREAQQQERERVQTQRDRADYVSEG